MNEKITIDQATRELGSVKGSSITCQPVRDSAQWAEVIIAELRQQVGLDWKATMQDLYVATVNLRDGVER